MNVAARIAGAVAVLLALGAVWLVDRVAWAAALHPDTPMTAIRAAIAALAVAVGFVAVATTRKDHP